MELKKMDLTSISGCKLNLDALYQIMPSAFTEVRDEKTGEIAHKINFNTLRELLGDNAYEGADEEYGFKWVGKNAARREASRPINKTLRPCPEESVDWDNTQNLYIEGDNLDVLKLLQKSYLGKVKMIYIDPPYNTGNDFVYRDNFAMKADGYDLAAGNVDELGNRFRKNNDSEGRFHSDWCSMIYERLLVARSLLSEDGVIFISIDDNEVENLKKVCNEVFGERNFIAQFDWMKTSTPPSLSKTIRKKFEYILCFAKNRTGIALNGGSVEGGDMPLLNESNAYATIKFPKESIEFRIADGHYCAGIYDRVLLVKDIDILEGKATTDIELSGNFKWKQQTVLDEVKSGTIFRIKTEKFAIRYERPGERIKLPSNIISKDECEVGTNEDGQKDIKQLFNNQVIMDYPKPVSLMKYLVRMICYDNDIILDFFSGSATTAHAVMKLNAEDGGNRKFIMVQLPEKTDEKSEAYKAGYSTICEIGKERIRRAGKKIKEENADKEGIDKLDIGFRVFKCENSFMNDIYFSPNDLTQADLFSHISNIKEGTSDLSILFGCMLDWGVQFSLPLSSFEVKGKTIYNVNDGDLLACFAENVDENIITAIAELMPLRVVFRDSCFSSVPLKMNLFEIFKQKCGWSEEIIKNRVHVI